MTDTNHDDIPDTNEQIRSLSAQEYEWVIGHLEECADRLDRVVEILGHDPDDLDRNDRNSELTNTIGALSSFTVQVRMQRNYISVRQRMDDVDTDHEGPFAPDDGGVRCEACGFVSDQLEEWEGTGCE